MRPNSILILVVAIVMGGIAAFLARSWLQSRTEVAKTQTTMIVAAAKQLPFGTPLTEDNTILLPWAAKTLPPGAFLSKQALLKDGRRATLATIQQNEPILSSKVTGPGQRASLSTLLANGMRAVTIRVDDVRGVAGFIYPNDRVDIILISSTAGAGSHSDVLLQDVKVIAVDQIASEQKDRPSVAKVVTVEVTPYQAQKIILATRVGQLSLVLRKAGDSTVAMDRRVIQGDLYLNEEAPPNVAPSAPAAPAPAPAKIEPTSAPSFVQVTIMRNLKSQEYKVVKEVE
jgi:pilus assembly protein CpaB